MSRRHQVNAIICLLLLAHAVYWFASGGAQTATQLRLALVIAQAVVGLGGAVWFWHRSRQAAIKEAGEK